VDLGKSWEYKGVALLANDYETLTGLIHSGVARGRSFELERRVVCTISRAKQGVDYTNRFQLKIEIDIDKAVGQ
jgi:hypothetical protein